MRAKSGGAICSAMAWITAIRVRFARSGTLRPHKPSNEISGISWFCQRTRPMIQSGAPRTGFGRRYPVTSATETRGRMSLPPVTGISRL